MASPRRLLALAAAAAVLGSALVACGSDDEVLPAEDGSVDGATATIQLPDGRLTFTVSDAGVVDPIQLTGAVDAPDGAHIGIDWDWKPWGGVPTDITGFLITAGPPPAISAEIDGRRWDLGQPTDAGAVLVPTDEDISASDVLLSVTFDDVEQTVRGDGSDRRSGRAEALYDLTTVAERAGYEPCTASVVPPEARGRPNCRAATIRLPYLTGLGWAEAGSAWLVVDVDIDLPRLRLRGEDIAVAAQEEELTVAGSAPEKVLTAQQRAGGGLRTQSAFDVPADEAQVAEVRRTVTTTGGVATEVEIAARLEERTS